MFSEHGPDEDLEQQSTTHENVAGDHLPEDDERATDMVAVRIIEDEPAGDLATENVTVEPVEPVFPPETAEPIDVVQQVSPAPEAPTIPPAETPSPVQSVPMPVTEGNVQQTPWPADQPGMDVVFDQDMTQWCKPGVPEEWETWTPPTETSPESLTDEGYSTEWGPVQATWPEDGEDVFPVTQQQEPQQPQLADTLGPGHVADQYWGYQGQTNYCVLYSAASILGELYGQPMDMDEMVARADANQWLVRDETGKILGINEEHFDDLLASYDVPSHQRVEGEQGAWEDLSTALVNDQRVIISLDSKEIDAKADVGTDQDADHAVAVTGIDYARQVVIVNDSARSAGLEIPMDLFFNAWRDGGFHMTTTDTSMPGGDGAVPPAGSSGLRPDAPGYTMMPFTLHLPSDTPVLPAPRIA